MEPDLLDTAKALGRGSRWAVTQDKSGTVTSKVGREKEKNM